MPRTSRSNASYEGSHRLNPPAYPGAHGSSERIKSHKLRNTLLAILFILIIVTALGGYIGYKLYGQAKEVKAHEEQAIALVKQLDTSKTMEDPQAISQVIPPLQQETVAAKQIAHGRLWNLAGRIPVYGGDVRAVQGMVDATDSLSQTTLPQLNATVQQLAGARFSDGNGQVNLAPIQNASQGMSAVNQSTHQQLTDLKALPTPKIGIVRRTYDQSVSQFENFSTTISRASNGLQILPQFLGSQGHRTYIIAAQTPAEARSSGGLIGSLGSMDAENGKVVINDFHPNTEFYGINTGGTPEEEALFSSPIKFGFDIRDISANPDFSHVAKSVNDRWQGSIYAGQVDGVIMIDPVFIQEIVKLNGGVNLPSGLALTGDNTAKYFMNTIYKTIPIGQQDGVFSAVAKQAMNDVLKNLNSQKLFALVKLMPNMAEGRHLYAYSFHDDEAKDFQGAGLAKDTPNSEENPEIGIYLNQNDSSKLDWYLHRQTIITRTSCNSNGGQTYHVKFTMNNQLDRAEMHTGNRDRDQYLFGGSPTLSFKEGSQVERMLFYAPAGGSISNFTIGGNATKVAPATLNGKQLYHSLATIDIGKSVTYEYDVTTSSKAKTDLKLDQTPMGWVDPGVINQNEACRIG